MRSGDGHSLRMCAIAASRSVGVGVLVAALAACTTVTSLLPATDAAPASNAGQVGATSPPAAASAPRPSAPVADASIPVRPEARAAFEAALAALRAGRQAEAERGFRALVQSDPELAGPHADLGLIARRAGHLPEAVAELERAAALAPALPAIWNQLGIAYREQGEFAKARAAYERALTADDRYADAVLNLGILDDLYLGDSESALALYTRYLALVPEGDATVTKWVADLNNRKAAAAKAAAAKEKS